jgi:tRNA(Ile2) C34 agmatinyltransferase TiaS
MSVAKPKCPHCGTAPFISWAFGIMFKCHVCGTVWKEEE